MKGISRVLNRLLGAKPSVPEIDVATLAADRAAGEDVQIVDVREPNEWAAGHLPDAVLIPLGELGRRAGELAPERPLVVVCRSGNRSATATDLLRRGGFRDVKNLAGGMTAWTQAGCRVVR
jgi:rhodanese-related sulfurtransferase